MQARVRENDRLQVVLQEFLRDARGLVDVAAANAQRPIDHGRIVENKRFLGGRRAVRIQHFDLRLKKARGQLTGIRNRGGAANELRFASIKSCDTAQAAKDITQMTAENAPVSVQLVEDDVAQILEQPRPARVVREDAGVQHVGIRQDHVAFFANGFSRVGGRVTIVGKNAETIFEALVQVVEFCELILRERLRGEKIKRACVGIF